MSETEKHALSALSALIVETLTGEEVGRFTKAANLCTLGQNLVRLQARTVAEVREADADAQNEGYGPAVYQAWHAQQAGNPVRAMRMPGAGRALANYGDGYNDQAELQRNLMLTLGPLASAQGESQRASAAAQEAEELRTLLELLEKVPEARRAAVQKRIDALFVHMEGRNVVVAAPAPESAPECAPVAAARASGSSRPSTGTCAWRDWARRKPRSMPTS